MGYVRRAKGIAMGAEENKAVFRRYVDEVLNKRNLDAIDELCDENVVFYFPEAVEGREALKETVAAALAPFSDLQVEIDRLIAEDDFASALCSPRATLAGEFMGQDVTGKHVSLSVVHTLRFANGRIVENRPIADQLALLMQLGITQIPQPT
jgi:predicted ester cyclase